MIMERNRRIMKRNNRKTVRSFAEAFAKEGRP